MTPAASIPPGAADREPVTGVLKAAYDAVLKERDFLSKEVLALNDRARMLWFLKTVGFVKADHPGLEYALKSGRLGKGTVPSLVKRLTRKRRKANR